MDTQNIDSNRDHSTLVRLGIILAGVLLISAAIFAIGTLTGVTAFVKAWDAFQDVLPWNKPTTVAVAPPDILGIRNMGRLETLEREVSAVVRVKRDYTLLDDEELLYGVCGRIVAGVDLEGLTPEDIHVEGDTLTLRLPSAEAFSVGLTTEWRVNETDEYTVEDDVKAQIVPSCDHIYKWSQATGHDKTPELVTDAQEQAQLMFEEMAQDPNFLARAQKNAENTLERLLKAAGYENVVFVDAQPNAEETRPTPVESTLSPPTATP